MSVHLLPKIKAELLPDASISVEKNMPWLDDGNVVLSCEGAARFRVHISVLKRHSEVFHNMFTDAIFKPGVAMVEGCPVIELDDRAEDCRNLMAALYGPLSLKMDTVDDFLHLSSVLLIATKYCVDWLRNRAIANLSRTWPHTLDAWLDLPDILIFKPVPHPALVVNLARAADVPILLPIALYRLGRLPLDEVYENQLTSSSGPIPHSAYRLSPEDTLNHLRYHTRQFHYVRSFIHGFIREFVLSETCSGQHTCRFYFRGLAAELESIFLSGLHAPLGILEEAGDCDGKSPNHLCRSCRTLFRSEIELKKLELWDALPGWFKLPGWDVLTADFVHIW